VDTAATTEPDTEKALQTACDFAVWQTTLFVQLDDGRLGIRSQLSGGGTESVRSLQGMPALDSAATLPTATDVNVELAVEWLSWDLDLILLIDMGFVDLAAAIGAGIR
jgi:hypothetical protein